MNNKIKQFIAFAICSFIALAACLGVLVVTVNNIEGDTSLTETKEIVNKTELDSSKETLVKYINNLILKTDNRFIKTKTYTDVSVSDLKVLNSSDKQISDEALLNFVKERIISVIDGYYSEDFAGSFEKNNSKKLGLLLNKNVLKYADFSIGQVDENGESVFDDEGNLIDSEYYYLIYNVDTENKAFDEKVTEMFAVKDDAFAKERFIKAIKDDCEIESFDAKPDYFTIKVKVNRENDKIQYINVIRNYLVKLNADFINDVAFFGQKEISFLYTVTDTCEYSYAGITFTEDEVTVSPYEEYMLNVNAVIDDDSEYVVEFISSDEDIATIDEMGYVKVIKESEEPVSITVRLTYLGETFTDTCIVNVSEN